MSNQFDNWNFLQQRFFASENFKTIEDCFQVKDESQLAQLFRDHKTRGVTDPTEMKLRRHMDEWLSDVSLLYLAYLSGYSIDPASTPAGNRILAILGHPSLSPFYERYYPTALPWLFRLHLDKQIQIQAEQAPGAFEHFAALFERFRNDRELSCFLDFLDGFQYGIGHSAITVETIANSFDNPNRIVEAVFRPKSQITPLDSGIIGMLRFATFSTSLYELLERCESFPILRSGFWFFYAYWFHEFEKDVTNLSLQAIQTAAAQAQDAASQALASQSQQRLDEIMTALKDGRYANALFQLVPADTLGDLSFDTEDIPTAEPGWTDRFAKYKKLS